MRTAIGPTRIRLAQMIQDQFQAELAAQGLTVSYVDPTGFIRCNPFWNGASWVIDLHATGTYKRHFEVELHGTMAELVKGFELQKMDVCTYHIMPKNG